MTFLAIIVAVLLLQIWGTAERVHFDDWFASWQIRVASWDLPGAISLALLVLLPSLVAIFVLDLVQPLLFGLLWLPLAAFLLLYAFGRGDFQASMARYRSHAYAGDFEAAFLAACEEPREDPNENPLIDGADDSEAQQEPASPDTPREVHAMIQRTLLYEGLQRWFAVLLYFALFGPAVAIAYRLLQLCRNSFEPQRVQRWLFLLDWLPARLLAATFALTGDFIGSRAKLLTALQNTSAGAPQVLYDVGEAALGPGGVISPDDEAEFGPRAAAQNREFDALLSRSAVCWIVILSLLDPDRWWAHRESAG